MRGGYTSDERAYLNGSLEAHHEHLLEERKKELEQKREEGCEHEWLNTGWHISYGWTPIARRRLDLWDCEHCGEKRYSSCKPYTRSVEVKA